MNQAFVVVAFLITIAFSDPEPNTAQLERLRESIGNAQLNTWYETGQYQPKGINFDYAITECSEDQLKKLAIGIMDAIALAKAAYSQGVETYRTGGGRDEAFIALFGSNWDVILSECREATLSSTLLTENPRVT